MAETTKEAPTTALEEYRPVAAGLAALRQRFDGVVFDCRTAAGDKAAREARRELVTLRTSLEAKRVEIKAPALERSRLIDSEAKRIKDAIVALEKPIDEQISTVEAEKEAERERKIAAEVARVSAIRARIVAAFSPPAPKTDGKRRTVAELIELIARYTDLPADNETYEELDLEAKDAKERALLWLDAAIADQTTREAEAADLARQRAAAAEERAALERDRAELRAREVEVEKAAAAAKAETDRVERERVAAQAEADRVRIAAEVAEKNRLTAEEMERRVAEEERARVEERRLAEAQNAEWVRQEETRVRLLEAAPEMLALLREWDATDDSGRESPTRLRLTAVLERLGDIELPEAADA